MLGYGWDRRPEEIRLGADLQRVPAHLAAGVLGQDLSRGVRGAEANTNPDAIGNAGGQYASQVGTSPGMLAIFETDFCNGHSDAPSASVPPTPTEAAPRARRNNYNISPGLADSAWKVPVTQADCNVEYPAVGGGPSGFGVVEENMGTNSSSITASTRRPTSSTRHR